MILHRLTGFLRNHGRISKGAERPSSTYLINPEVSIDNVVFCFVLLLFQKWGRPSENGFNHVVLTLDPSKFAEKKQPRLHISNIQSFRPYIALHNQPRPVLGLHIYYNRNDRSEIPPLYPPNTTAFLYYSTPPEKPRIAGELRLRIASSDDHASFEGGSDLLMSNGLPWSRSLVYVSKHYFFLYKKLREDGFVSDDLDAVLSTLPKILLSRQVLYTLNDPFIVDFNSYIQQLAIVSEQGMKELRLAGPCVEQRKGRLKPYTGAHINHRLSIFLD
jgi:hypothetical protein